MDARILAIASLLGLASGCILPGDAAGTSGIHGIAMVGPTCPVERDPPDPECKDRPYSGPLVVVTPDDRVVKEFESAENGTFRVTVAPGEYHVRSKQMGNPPTCSTP